MKKTLAVLTLVLTLGMTATLDAQAKRLGGGKSAGMQRQNVTQPANSPAGTPGSPAQAAPAAGAAAAAAAPAAAAAKRSWMGPLAGLAAGIGLMALASHFGFGEALANMMMIGLLVMAVLLVVGLVMRKRAMGRQGPALAGAGAGAGGFGRAQAPQGNAYRNDVQAPQRGSLIGSGIGGSLAAANGQVANIPADFDTAAFERNAKDRFMDLQAANDAGDLTRLRDYLTPEMFEVVRDEIESRDGKPQRTEVFGLNARVLDVAEEATQYVVSVRLTGGVRLEAGAAPDALDEIWHLSKPRTGFGGWVVAGIQQVEPGQPGVH